MENAKARRQMLQMQKSRTRDLKIWTPLLVQLQLKHAMFCMQRMRVSQMDVLRQMMQDSALKGLRGFKGLRSLGDLASQDRLKVTWSRKGLKASKAPRILGRPMCL